MSRYQEIEQEDLQRLLKRGRYKQQGTGVNKEEELKETRKRLEQGEKLPPWKPSMKHCVWRQADKRRGKLKYRTCKTRSRWQKGQCFKSF